MHEKPIPVRFFHGRNRVVEVLGSFAVHRHDYIAAEVASALFCGFGNGFGNRRRFLDNSRGEVLAQFIRAYNAHNIGERVALFPQYFGNLAADRTAVHDLSHDLVALLRLYAAELDLDRPQSPVGRNHAEAVEHAHDVGHVAL